MLFSYMGKRMKSGFFYIGFFISLFLDFNIYSNESYFHQSVDIQKEVGIAYHPVHISYTHIEFNQSTNKFEILIKLFVDDFDLILYQKYGKNLKLIEGKMEKGNDETIKKYINEHLKVIINGNYKTKPSIELLKTEFKDLSIWLHFDFSFKGNCSTFEIYNSLMTDLYPDQTNLLIFTFKDEQKAFKFNSGKTKEQLTL